MVDNKCKKKTPETKEKNYFCLNVSIYSRTCIFHIYTSSLIITSILMFDLQVADYMYVNISFYLIIPVIFMVQIGCTECQR